MAEDQDRESKTEEATPRRVEEALAKGNQPFSRELGSAAALIAVGLGFPIAVSWMATHVAPGLAIFLDRPGEVRLENSDDVMAVASLVAVLMGTATLPVLIGFALAGVLSSALQNPPRFVLQRITPEFSRVSPAKGFQRIFGATGRAEFLKSVVKFALVTCTILLQLRSAPERVVAYTLMRPDDLVRALIRDVANVFLTTGLLMIGLAAVDLLWVRAKWRKDLRMSRQELKEEHKQAEGDPIVRARQRSLARSRARQRMIAAVPRATVVVANPTHYAVALRYVQGETATPIVIAKGIDHIALRIREMAEDHDVPVIEDKALARSLYAAVKTDRPIPPEFYRAVAEILLYLMTRKGKQYPPTSYAA
jgi:flagellar biosynthetic protein FlhB